MNDKELKECPFCSSKDILFIICEALGWQGGTIHQVIDEIKRLKGLQPHPYPVNQRLIEVLELILERYYEREIKTINNLEVDTICKIEKAIQSAKEGQSKQTTEEELINIMNQAIRDNRSEFITGFSLEILAKAILSAKEGQTK